MKNTSAHRWGEVGVTICRLELVLAAMPYVMCNNPGATESIQGDTAADGIGTSHR